MTKREAINTIRDMVDELNDEASRAGMENSDAVLIALDDVSEIIRDLRENGDDMDAEEIDMAIEDASDRINMAHAWLNDRVCR